VSIRFNYKIRKFRVRKALNHRRWLDNVIVSEGRVVGLVNFVFTDDEDIIAINQEFLKHNYLTDVITFDYSTAEAVLGEIYISIDTVRRNAIEYGTTAASEFRRIMVHGILHLCGYGDSTGDEIEVMRKMEDGYLKMYNDEFRI
jgi:probable rRNA maturation factor